MKLDPFAKPGKSTELIVSLSFIVSNEGQILNQFWPTLANNSGRFERFAITSLEGSIPKSKMKLLSAWVEIHQEELIADWNLAVSGEQPFKIEPLR